jgi:hypothetical protein
MNTIVLSKRCSWGNFKNVNKISFYDKFEHLAYQLIRNKKR